MDRLSQPADIPGFQDVTQLAVITPDARVTAERVAAALGIGGFKLVTLTEPALFNCTMNGRPIDGAMRVALTWVGDMQLEIIEPLSDDTVYADYLRSRQGRAGIEHVFLQPDGIGYEAAGAVFAAAGFPPVQHGQMNAAGRIGFLPMPPLPGLLAPRLATRFCYTSTQDELLLDFELAKFAFGVSARVGLRIAAADEWIPEANTGEFETLPADAAIERITGLAIVAREVAGPAAAYSRLTRSPVSPMPLAGTGLPGSGTAASIRFRNTTIHLVAPTGGPLRSLAPGASIVCAATDRSVAHSAEQLTGRGWDVLGEGQHLLAQHGLLPFSLWLTARVPN